MVCDQAGQSALILLFLAFTEFTFTDGFNICLNNTEIFEKLCVSLQ